MPMHNKQQRNKIQDGVDLGKRKGDDKVDIEVNPYFSMTVLEKERSVVVLGAAPSSCNFSAVPHTEAGKGQTHRKHQEAQRVVQETIEANKPASHLTPWLVTCTA